MNEIPYYQINVKLKAQSWKLGSCTRTSYYFDLRNCKNFVVAPPVSGLDGFRNEDACTSIYDQEAGEHAN